MDFADAITTVFSDFGDPKKRVFLGYIGLSIVIAIVWLLVVKRHSLRSSLAKVFDRDVIWSGSAKADYKIFLINRAVTLFISPLLVTQLTIATAIFYFLHSIDFIHAGSGAGWGRGPVVALFSVAMFVMDDFSKYLVHRWMHHWPLLWAIHKVHHSAETMTPVTVYRVHPLEGILYALRSVVAQGVVISVFAFFFGDLVDLYTVLGVNVLVFVFHVTGSNLRHSHIDIQYWGWLEHVFISPAQHQLHHSVAEEHFDKNFGAALAVWDWLFGSLHLSEQEKTLEFGLGPNEASATDLVDIYTRPFTDMAAVVRRRWRRARGWLAQRRV